MFMDIKKFSKIEWLISAAFVLVISLKGAAFALPGPGEEELTFEAKKLLSVPTPANNNDSEDEDWDAEFCTGEETPPFYEGNKLSHGYIENRFKQKSVAPEVIADEQLHSEDWLVRNMARIQVAINKQQIGKNAEMFFEQAVQDSYPEALMLFAEREAQKGNIGKATDFYRNVFRSLLENRREFLEESTEGSELQESSTFCRLKAKAVGLASGKHVAIFGPVYADYKDNGVLFPSKAGTRSKSCPEVVVKRDFKQYQEDEDLGDWDDDFEE